MSAKAASVCALRSRSCGPDAGAAGRAETAATVRVAQGRLLTQDGVGIGAAETERVDAERQRRAAARERQRLVDDVQAPGVEIDRRIGRFVVKLRRDLAVA